MNTDTKKYQEKIIKNFRKAKNLTQEELAFKIDVDISYIGKVERARMNISIDKIIKLADALEVPVKVLFDHDLNN